MNVFNDGIAIVIGFLMGQLGCCDHIYKGRAYVIDRLYYERSINYNRNAELERVGGELFEEYPFSGVLSISDKDLSQRRTTPQNIIKEREKMKEKMDSINEDFKEV
eukprot:CAMPEP_0170552032 /NCGR_PEP_ID=MMETSP0211-20121228/10016_1 /TAXON_ID=311385 /ORGANISM="Pseudokeronopsis sp., Strain OXSARD2" /LENGTH=105 /DNA_ID=CAMNT_0010859567 /DNA_START=193 /DNA_END=506 /DNA_ORIENTATION=-